MVLDLRKLFNVYCAVIICTMPSDYFKEYHFAYLPIVAVH